MTNACIAAALVAEADRLERVHEPNPYKVKAYREGALEVAAWGERVSFMAIEPQSLRKIPGIGPSLSKFIEHVVFPHRADV